MKTVMILFLMCFSLGAAAGAPTRLRIAFDMQGVTMGGGGATPGFGEMLQILTRDPRVEIYFYSTQSRRGIAAQLREVRLPDGRTADEVGQIIEGERMTDLDDPPPAPVEAHGDAFAFGARRSPSLRARYKDLRVISPDPTDLTNTVLVDDDEYKAHPDQFGHLLWVPRDVIRTVPKARSRETDSPPVRPFAADPEDPPRAERASQIIAHEAPPPGAGAAPAPAPVTPPAPIERKGWWARFNDFVAGRPSVLPELASKSPAVAGPPRPRTRSFDDGYAPTPVPPPRDANARSNLMLGALTRAIADADRGGVSLAQALRDIAWEPDEARRSRAWRLRLDRAEVTAELIAYGETVRADAKCEFKLNQPEAWRPLR